MTRTLPVFQVTIHNDYQPTFRVETAAAATVAVAARLIDENSRPSRVFVVVRPDLALWVVFQYAPVSLVVAVPLQWWRYAR